MSNAELIERLRNFDSEFDSDKILDEAADALELADKRIAEQAEEITMLRYRHLITCGTTHPEMYKTELDHAKERIAEEREQHDIMMERGAEKLAEAERRIAELEKEAQFNFEQYQDAGRLLCEANEKLAVARDALSAMLTHMGMDEDEWNKPTFDKAREALAQIAATEQK